MAGKVIRLATAALGLSALFLSRSGLANDFWTVLMCQPAPTCIGDCRPQAMVFKQAAASQPALKGCIQTATYPSYDFARRSADTMNGRPPQPPSLSSFDFYFSEGEKFRARNDRINALNMYQNAASRAGSMEEWYYLAESYAAMNDTAKTWDALARAKDLSSRKLQYQLVGDAFAKAGRHDQAQQLYDKMRNATQ
jgi:tetratricopeptide (TPR) repeat protein